MRLIKDNGYDLSFLSSITPFYYGYRHHIFNYHVGTLFTVQDYCNGYGSFYGYKILRFDKTFFI